MSMKANRDGDRFLRLIVALAGMGLAAGGYSLATGDGAGPRTQIEGVLFITVGAAIVLAVCFRPFGRLLGRLVRLLR